MSSQDLSWNLHESTRYEDLSHVVEMRRENPRNPAIITWANSGGGKFFRIEDSGTQPHSRPRRSQTQESEEFRSEVSSHSPHLASASRKDIVRRPGGSSRFRFDNRPHPDNNGQTSNTPIPLGQSDAEDTELFSEDELDTPIIAPHTHSRTSNRRARGVKVTYRLHRHLSEDFVPSSQQGEKDTNPSTPRVVPMPPSTDDDDEIVPESAHTSMDASFSSKSFSNIFSSARLPAALGSTNTYKITRAGRPEVIPIQKRLTGLQQRPQYP
ncbi:unnamed protein product [Peniophora sp. CBMAI 1063]|nr:unnamed protein product [Peniophora sp. CBMAI 1063]